MIHRKSILGLFVAFLFACQFTAHSQLVLPNLSVIGKKAESSVSLLDKTKTGIYPAQMSLDFSTNGTIYGFICEYEPTQDNFEKLKAQIPKVIGVEPKLNNTNMVIWRNEQRKISIQLSYLNWSDDETEPNMSLKLIAVSVDKKVRAR